MWSKLSQFRRSITRRLIPRDARSSVRMWLAGPWEDGPPRLIGDFDAQPVLVLAPHADDEVIGPGGTIRRHQLAGARITVAILTDGRWGGYNGDGSLVERRKEESRRAAEIIGTAPPLFFDAPDGKLEESPELLARLAPLFTDGRPKYVYLPAMTDGHPDHWGTNRILNALLASLPGEVWRNLVIRGYEVWTPALANCCVDITGAAEVKRQAIEVFASQTGANDYTSAALGLNRYRSLQHLHGRGYVEAFMEMTPGEFRGLFQAASLRHQPK